MSYFIKPVVCDYGIYWLDDKGELNLIVICNNLSNAEMVEEILNLDDKHKVWSKPQGEWIGDTDYESYQGSYEAYKCSKCGYGLHWRDYYSNKYNFCPNCGAKMK